jgi:hypothetical protein
LAERVKVSRIGRCDEARDSDEDEDEVEDGTATGATMGTKFVGFLVRW